MRPSRICACFILLTIALLGQCALADILTTKSGNQYEGEVQERDNEYRLVKPDGGKMSFPKSMVESVEKKPVSPAATPGPVKAPLAQPAAGAGVKPTGEEKLIWREATGVGTDADKALQAAFSLAIESAVGVMVDAVTVVKNDQIIKDQILTFSRGLIQEFKVVEQGQKEGLYYAKIKALVQTGKLAEKLTAQNIATHEVPGELIARQIRFDFKNEKEAAEMLKKILDDFDMRTLTKVEELAGERTIKRDGASAKMHIKAMISPDMDAWEKYS